MTEAHEVNLEVAIAVLEERTKATLSKMGEVVAKLDTLVEQIVEIRATIPTWQSELARFAERQMSNENRIAVLEGTIGERIHNLEMKNSNRDVREGVFVAILRSPFAAWLAAAIAGIAFWFNARTDL